MALFPNGVRRVLSVVGARPNFMKVAPLHRALEERGGFTSRVLHTGQHYDERMSDVFFRQLGLPEPHRYLGVGSGTHAEQTGAVMVGFEEALADEQPDLVVVVGDVNSTLACALVAAKAHVPVAHVEAGLRSGDRRMPEEINRLATDSIADLLFVSEPSGVEHLRAEGANEARIHFVGNVMIDSLVQFRAAAAEQPVLTDLGVEPGAYVLVTMHRPSTVDRPEGMAALVETLERVAAERPIVFPLHPRTKARAEAFGVADRLASIANLTLLGPVGYLEFLRLMDCAALVLTDSGGIQEETTYLCVPCLTVRENTERPATITHGTNELVPLDPALIARRVTERIESGVSEAGPPPLWDGRAAARIVDVLETL